MVEEDILLEIHTLLSNIKVDANNSNSAPLFKKVIANNAPIWTAVEVTPSVCYYLADTMYEDAGGLRINGKSNLLIYVYNKHRAGNLSLKDMLSPLIAAIRAEVMRLPTVNASILDATVVKVSRDGGTVLPYTVAELTVEVNFVETKSCS